MRNFYDPNVEELRGIYYFSAVAAHRSVGSVQRHRSYIEALESTGVNVLLGRFKQKTLTCKCCKQRYPAYEEKESDVQLAVTMTVTALHDGDAWDRAILISGDSDFASTVASLVKVGKGIRVVGPPGRHLSHDLTKATGRKGTVIKPIHLERAQLADAITLADGRQVRRPDEWSARPPRGP